MKRWYEGLFLFDSAHAAKEPEETASYLKELLDKHGGEIRSFERWDDRRLAYEIDGIRRGTYYLVVMQMDPQSVAGLRRDCNLSERVVRFLMIQDDELLERMEERARIKKKRDEEAAQAAAEGLPVRRGRR